MTATADEIMGLIEQYGDEDYDGEPVSQTSHMIQCAMLAMKNSEDVELVLGAFLHDIGHLLKHQQHTETMGQYGVVNHEGLGARYLRSKGFSEKICAVVELHVQAKRYLVATDPAYGKKLSPASWQTLQWQGGPMSEEEVQEFELHPYFADSIHIRLWDERAKDTHALLLPLAHFDVLIREHLNKLHI